jgi:hypothetical protein
MLKASSGAPTERVAAAYKARRRRSPRRWVGSLIWWAREEIETPVPF